MEENYFTPSLNTTDIPQGKHLFKDNLFLEINRILFIIGIIFCILLLGYTLTHYDLWYGERGVGGALALAFISLPVFATTLILFIIDKFYIYNKVLMSKNTSVFFRLNKFFLIGFPFTTPTPLLLFINPILQSTYNPIIVSQIIGTLNIIILIIFVCSLILDMKLSNDFIKRYKKQSSEPTNYTDTNNVG
jgi:hypothetical protein